MGITLKYVESANVGVEWSSPYSVSYAGGNIVPTVNGGAAITYTDGSNVRIAFAPNIKEVLEGTAIFGSPLTIMTYSEVYELATVQTIIDSILYLIITYYDSIKDTYNAELWIDKTGIGSSYIFKSLIATNFTPKSLPTYSAIYKLPDGYLVCLLDDMDYSTNYGSVQAFL